MGFLSNLLFEPEEQSAPVVPTAPISGSSSMVNIPIPSGLSTPVQAPEDVTSEEIRAAQLTVLGWAQFSSMPNLKAFVDADRKLAETMPDPAQRLSTVMTVLSVNTDTTTVISEADRAVQAVTGSLVTLKVDVASRMKEIAATETSKRAELATRLNSLQVILNDANKRIAEAEAEIAGLSGQTAAQVAAVERTAEITEQFAQSLVTRWKAVAQYK